MNGILMEDPACSQRALCLKTYKVIPMTPRCIQTPQSPVYISQSSVLEAVIVARGIPHPALRSHFVLTHATLSICHYVLGIGDRHLSNFMVDLESGAAVGIDFVYIRTPSVWVSVGLV